MSRADNVANLREDIADAYQALAEVAINVRALPGVPRSERGDYEERLVDALVSIRNLELNIDVLVRDDGTGV